tara:strand:+ start:329 stop:520 length:192 start_codon:yes stop_codon:yes gene_type:complete
MNMSTAHCTFEIHVSQFGWEPITVKVIASGSADVPAGRRIRTIRLDGEGNTLGERYFFLFTPA